MSKEYKGRCSGAVCAHDFDNMKITLHDEDEYGNAHTAEYLIFMEDDEWYDVECDAGAVDHSMYEISKDKVCDRCMRCLTKLYREYLVDKSIEELLDG